ncbi:MAG: ATP synthase F0 subunit C [Planctomycetes bacterium]|nr:ATP synthase F0 subunit C [Planctomycetota bacterium]
MSDLATIALNIAQAIPAAEAVTTHAVANYAPLGRGIAFGVAAGGAGVGIGLVFAAAIQGIARQPEQAGVLRGLMFLGFALIEALALIGFVLAFIL